MERFEVFRTVINENTRVEEVKTADGVKRRIRLSDRASDGFLCHTRLFLEFDETEHLHGLGQAEEGAWNLRGNNSVPSSGKQEDCCSSTALGQRLRDSAVYPEPGCFQRYAIRLLFIYGGG